MNSQAESDRTRAMRAGALKGKCRLWPRTMAFFLVRVPFVLARSASRCFLGVGIASEGFGGTLFAVFM
jgi:hypothetical protein